MEKEALDALLVKMRAWCAYQERCQQEARDKLHVLGGLTRAETGAIIATLIAENFINEERFARAFAGGRFRIKKWGRIKIRSMLKQKRISSYSIEKALEEINEQEYRATLSRLLEGKRRLLKSEPNKIRKNYKLLRFAQSRGYETDLALEIINED